MYGAVAPFGFRIQYHCPGVRSFSSADNFSSLPQYQDGVRDLIVQLKRIIDVVPKIEDIDEFPFRDRRKQLLHLLARVHPQRKLVTDPKVSFSRSHPQVDPQSFDAISASRLDYF